MLQLSISIPQWEEIGNLMWEIIYNEHNKAEEICFCMLLCVFMIQTWNWNKLLHTGRTTALVGWLVWCYNMMKSIHPFAEQLKIIVAKRVLVLPACAIEIHKSYKSQMSVFIRQTHLEIPQNKFAIIYVMPSSTSIKGLL